MPIRSAFISFSVSANYSGSNSCFYQVRLYCGCLFRRFLRSRTPRRFSFRLCMSSRFIWWIRPTIITWKRVSSFYKDDLPWDFGGHWEHALWSSGGSLIRPQNGVIAVDTIFNLYMASIAIVTRETVICHSLCPARLDIYVPPFKLLGSLPSKPSRFPVTSDIDWLLTFLPHFNGVTPGWLSWHAIYLWSFFTSRWCYVFRRMYLVRFSQGHWRIGLAYQCIRTVCTCHGC